MGKKVSFEIAKDIVEGSTHRTKRTEEDEVQTYPDMEGGPLADSKTKSSKKVVTLTLEKDKLMERCKTDRVWKVEL